MNQTATKAHADAADGTSATSDPGRPRRQLVPAIALGVAIIAAALSVVAIATGSTSTAPPQTVVQQNVPAGGELSQGVGHINVDDCGRPIVPGRMACR